jgi:hypothetical protein
MNFAIPKNVGQIEIVKRKVDQKLQKEVKDYLDNESIFNFS